MSECPDCGLEFANAGGLGAHRARSSVCPVSDRVVELYQSGMSGRAVADELELPKTAVLDYLQEVGVSRSTSAAQEIAWDHGRFGGPDPDLEPSPRLAWLTGVLYGDGSVFRAASNDYVVALGAKDVEFRDAFADALEAIGLTASTTIQEFDHRADMHHARANSKLFYNWWNETARPGHAELAREHPAAFVRGMYDSEGSLSDVSDHMPPGTSTYWRLSLSNTEDWLLTLVRDLAAGAGVEFTGPHGGSATDCKSLVISKDGAIERFCEWAEPTIPRKDYRSHVGV